ncbi:unnamed protein product [Periconia digitata]|uniref:Uncharacterized protein n=1 Tax=Periconia digitata TaxID=1303443 RepID=A0A9W4XE70_9PLEO|nr:unnamed protein product [Periconia digitata]
MALPIVFSLSSLRSLFFSGTRKDGEKGYSACYSNLDFRDELQIALLQVQVKSGGDSRHTLKAMHNDESEINVSEKILLVTVRDISKPPFTFSPRKPSILGFWNV